MFQLYILLYVTLLGAFSLNHLGRKSPDHVFAPWPGYALIFSTYFLFGTTGLATPVTDNQWFVYGLSIAGFWAGSLIVRAGVPVKKVNSPVTLAAQKNYFISSLNIPLVAAVSLTGLTITLYLWQRSGIPLFSSNVDDARTSMVSNGYIAQVATSLDVAAIFSLAFIFAAWGRKRSLKFWICVGVVVIFVAVALLSGSRSRFLKLVLPGVVLFHFLVRPIRLKWIVILAFGGVMFIGALGYYRWYSLWGVVNRAEGPTIDMIFSYATYELSTAASGLDIVLKTIPTWSPHTYGYLHLGPFTTPFGSGIPTPGEYFKQMIGGRWAGFGLAATFIAPMYADFSYVGVFFMSALYCSIIMLAFRITQRAMSTRIYSLCVYAIIFFFTVSGIRSDWLSFEFIWFVGVGLAFYIMRRRGPKLRIEATFKPAGQSAAAESGVDLI